jgi:hypothetical protein
VILSILIQILNNRGQNLLHFDSIVIKALFDSLPNHLNILSQVGDLLEVVLLFGDMESSDDVLDLFHVLKTETTKVPVIHDESEVVFDFDLVGNCSSVSESLAHDGDEHVQKMDQHDEG